MSSDDFFSKMWKQDKPSEADLEEMMQTWNNVQISADDIFENILGSDEDESDIMERMKELQVKKPYEYKFQESNPYINDKNLFELGQQLNKDLKIQQAMMSLEADVQQNPESVSGWRELGQLH